MKKKSCLTLALILVIVQVVSLFAVLPVSAETTTKSYSLIKATETMEIDGAAKEDVWALADWSDPFVKASNSEAELGDFSAKFKAVWAPVEDDETKMDIYILIYAEGHKIQYNWRNGMRVYIQSSDGSLSFWTGMKQLNGNIINNTNKPILYGGVNPTDANRQMKLNAVNDFANTQSATYEFCYRMDRADSIKLEVSALASADESNKASVSASWCGGDANSATGLGVGKILSVNTNPGASIRVDTSEKATSGIRFVSSVDMTRFNAWRAEGATITTGTLIVPTENLTKKSIEGDFTKATLTDAGLVENTHFYDIVNKESEWVAGEEGTWYATLYNIQEYTRAFTAVGYVTVTVGGEATTYYAIPSESRSIAQVAETLMNGEEPGDTGNWTAAQEAVLNSFFTQGG